MSFGQKVQSNTTPPPYHSLKKKSKNNNKNNNRKIPGKVISVRAMMNEYRQNSDKAKSRYENKTIFVQGKVTHIGGGFVVLEDVLHCCGFSMGSERAMHLGQKVVIAGKVCVRWGNAEVENGSVVKKFPFRG